MIGTEELARLEALQHASMIAVLAWRDLPSEERNRLLDLVRDLPDLANDADVLGPTSSAVAAALALLCACAADS